MGEVSNEPTMEDILSSIKKIISDDSAKALSAPRARKFAPQNDPVPVADVTPKAVEDDVLELTEAAESPVDQAEQVQPVSLVSDSAATQSRSALDQLSAMIVKPEVTGADTLEGMVREMLRPMLKEWLDANLPRVVEGLVSQEIARISGKSLI